MTVLHNLTNRTFRLYNIKLINNNDMDKMWILKLTLKLLAIYMEFFYDDLNPLMQAKGFTGNSQEIF